MTIATTELSDNTKTHENQNTHTTAQGQLIAKLQSASESRQALKTIDTDANPLVEPNNIELAQSRRDLLQQNVDMPLLQIYSQQARLRELIEQKATMMTPEQVQRLQACVQQITAIIHEQSSARERKRFKHRSCKLIRY